MGDTTPRLLTQLEIHSRDSEGNLAFAGRGGWYDAYGWQHRDTDWFLITIGSSGNVTVTLDAEVTSNLAEIGPQDCNDADYLQLSVTFGCHTAALDISGAPGSEIWLFVASNSYSPPESHEGNEFNYLLQFQGLAPSPVATQPATWSRAWYRVRST